MRRLMVEIVVFLMLSLFGCSTEESPLTQGRWEGIVRLAGQPVFIYIDRQGAQWTAAFPELMISQVQLHDVKAKG